MAPALSQHRAVTWALVLGVCLLMLSGVAGPAGADSTTGEFTPRQVIIKLGTSGATVGDINTTYGSTTLERFPGSSDVYLLQLRAGSGVIETVEEMTADGRLLYAEPNFVAQTPEGDSRHKAWGVSDVGPSSQDYAASALNLSIAQSISRGDGVTVAVLDTGAQLDHLALADNFEDVKRYDFVGDDFNPSDRRVGADTDGDGLEDDLWGHGTHVAGIVDFVAPAAKIMPIRVLDTEGYGNVFAIAKAVGFAERNGASVINLSLGSLSRSKLLRNEIKRVTEGGVLVAASAGNANSTVPHYPAAGNGVAASADGLVAVTSVNMYGRKSGFANYGSWIDIAAPGEAIRSAFPINVFASWSGTSMATPFVSGQAALIHAVDASLDPADIEERIRCSARPLLLTDPIYGAMLGKGQADAGASLAPGVCSS